ncbi:MAG: collagen binding domain-containing protein [Coprobacillaceae bacterium]
MRKIKEICKKHIKVMLVALLLLGGVTQLGIMDIEASSHNVTEEFYSEYTAVTGNGGVWGVYASLRVDGEVSWCLQADKPVKTGVNNMINFSDIGISNEQRTILGLIGNFGYFTQPSRESEVLTQNAIWTYLGYTDWYPTASCPTRDAFNSWYDNVMSKVSAYGIGVSFYDTSHTINVGETLTLTDTNGVLSSMQVYSTDGLDVSISGNDLVITGTIGANDVSEINLMKPISNQGTNFVVRDGSSQAVSVCKTEDPKMSWLNIKVNKYIDVTLSKVDSENNEFKPQGDASLIGSKFGLYDASNDQLLDEKVIDETGSITFNQLWANMNYYIQEISSGEGYVLNGEKFYIDPGQLLSSGTVGANLQYSMTVGNQVMKQSFTMIKVSSNGESTEVPTLEGSEWTVQLKSDIASMGIENAPVYDVLTTDSKGFAQSIELPYGEYNVRETKTPVDVETARDFTVIIDKDSREPQTYRVLNDAPYESYVKIVKTDFDTNETIVFDSVGLQFYNELGELYRQKVADKWIDTFITDETGTVTTPLKMKAGTYYLYEVKTPKGYLTLEEPLEIVITNQGAVQVDEDGDPILEIVIKNEKPTAKVVINKSFETLENETVEDTEELPSDEVVEETETTEETKYAKFKVEVQSDIINPSNGEVLYKKGDVINNLNSEDGLYMTAENMQVIIDNLPMGIDTAKFKIIEVETSDGYKLTDPIEVEFTQEDLTTKEYVYTIDVENKLYKPYIGTLATGINGEKVLDPTIDNEIIDTLAYEDFDTSKEYTLVTEFVCKETGEVIASAKEENIILDASSGEYVVSLTILANTVKDGEYYFREFFYTSDNPDTPYAEHNDPNDEGQTIRFETPSQPITPTPTVTGDNTNIMLYVGLGIVAVGLCVGLVISKKKKKEDK